MTSIFEVLHFDFNAQKIEKYEIKQHYFVDELKSIKKKHKTREAFEERLRSIVMYYFWSKCEWELVIIKENGRIYLEPWVGCRDKEKARIDITDNELMDWKAFADIHINKQIYKNCAKIDVYDQIEFRWQEFSDRCWEIANKRRRKGEK